MAASSHWIDIQQNAFTRWCNEHLKDRGMHINDLGKDLADGLLLINLLEIISGKSVGRYNKNPKIPTQKLENTAIAMKFVADEGVKTVNIGNEDITNGKLKLILGLIWTLILRYQINKGGSDSDAKNDLLKWVRSKIPEYDIKGFTKDWNDGKAICALVDALAPGTCKDHRSLNPGDALANATRGIDAGYNTLGVPRIVLPDEMVHPKVDEHAMMTYIAYYRDLDGKALDDAARSRAYGPGLISGVVGEDAPFTVETPNSSGKLEVKVVGPKSTAQVKVVPKGNGNYDVTYQPTEPGIYKVHVTLNGKHIPGSIFTVEVLQQESLGGEGKIRVFYTTTTASNEKTRPLQELLEKKGVHLRPDFEPWIPVDIMDKPDRDAVFRRAGTKVLPIIFIDDVYIGDYYAIAKLNDSGELDKMLKTNEGKYQQMFSGYTPMTSYKAPSSPSTKASAAPAKKWGTVQTKNVQPPLPPRDQ
eukprot:TRINITY_DN17323_c0_g1_i1.p1 TRINITY_DN17323_c0_g1~~TRINITY_DN17323_c0_g1_i1.p1  ORF type:complete len:494 (-),score=154.72 TRINITY_DN17323_c0_g1_i1:202-1620(-)